MGVVKYIRSLFGAAPAESMFRDSTGAVVSPSSFGAADTTFGPEFGAIGLWNSERRRELEFRRRYYSCTQHDHKRYDGDGRMVQPGPPTSNPFYSTDPPPYYVALSMRRPAVPVRLAKIIVRRFTSFLFGRERFPQIRVVGDPDTQDFFQAVVEAADMHSVFIRARNIGGAVGTVGLSWKFFDGVPSVCAHSGENLHVLEWADRERLAPRHVAELYQRRDTRWDPKKGQRVPCTYWCRRDWTPEADVVFVEQEVVAKQEPTWVVDAERTVRHGDGEPHFVWVQNLPDDDADIDGAPDYDDLYEPLDALDSVNSTAHRGVNLNLDPTLVLKVDPGAKYDEVRKGSEHAIVLGPAGSANYMELSGSSVQAGETTIARERSQILEASSCVVPDPNTIAAAGTSALGIKLVYAPMLDVVDVLRTQYGRPIRTLFEQMGRSLRRRLPELGDDGEPIPVYEVDEEGNELAEQPTEFFVRLPPRVVEELGEDGKPTGASTVVERRLGKGGRIELEWGEDFKPTPDDMQKQVGTLSAAAGGKAVLSHKSAVEIAAKLYEKDPIEEWAAVEKETATAEAKAAQQDASMFPSIGDPAALPAAGNSSSPEPGEPLD